MQNPDANIGPIEFLDRFKGDDLDNLKKFIKTKINRQHRLSFDGPQDIKKLRGDWRWTTMFEDGDDISSTIKVYVVMRMRPKSDHGFAEDDMEWYIGQKPEIFLKESLQDFIDSDNFDMELVPAKGWRAKFELGTQMENGHPYTIEFEMEITD